MTIRAIGQNDGNTQLNTIVKSTAAGTAAGYAAKWIWPVMKQEDKLDKRALVNYCHKVTNKAKSYEFEKLAHKTKAQKEFMDMVKTGYENTTMRKGEIPIRLTVFSKEGIAKRVAKLGGENSASGKELRSIIRNVNESSKQMLNRFATSYGIMLKKIRQPIPFLVAGAGVGFFTGFTHNVMKTDYYA